MYFFFSNGSSSIMLCLLGITARGPSSVIEFLLFLDFFYFSVAFSSLFFDFDFFFFLSFFVSGDSDFSGNYSKLPGVTSFVFFFDLLFLSVLSFFSFFFLSFLSTVNSLC